MGLFSFIKDAGEKLFGSKEVEQAAAQASPSLDELNTKAAHAIRDYIETQNLGVTGLYVSFDGASGKVTVQGEAPTEEASEKVTLCCGNMPTGFLNRGWSWNLMTTKSPVSNIWAVAWAKRLSSRSSGGMAKTPGSPARKAIRAAIAGARQPRLNRSR